MTTITVEQFTPTVVVSPAPKEHQISFHVAGGRAYLVAQRIMDVVISSLLIVLLAPLMLLVAAAIRIVSPGPATFRQVRAGLHGKPFVMYKFRSMRVGAQDERSKFEKLNEQKHGPVFKIANDPRLIPLGRLLRRTSLDELPQLFNVLAGHMSLVGPRPLWMPEAKRVTGSACLRTTVKPGMTCLWQISGRSELDYREWVRLDLCYIRHRTLLLDLLILIQTIPAVLSCHGAY